MTIDTADHVLHRPSIRVIDMTPFYCECQRCSKQVLTPHAWPYYQEFLHPQDASTDAGYVPVCDECDAWLAANSNKLWLRTPKSVVYHRAMLAERTRFEQQAQAARGERL